MCVTQNVIVEVWINSSAWIIIGNAIQQFRIEIAFHLSGSLTKKKLIVNLIKSLWEYACINLNKIRELIWRFIMNSFNVSIYISTQTYIYIVMCFTHSECLCM